MNKYQETRTAWKQPVEPYVKKTYKDIKMRETSYDPILQKYRNPNIEDRLAELEKQAFIDVLAKNKVINMFRSPIFRIALWGMNRPTT